MRLGHLSTRLAPKDRPRSQRRPQATAEPAPWSRLRCRSVTAMVALGSVRPTAFGPEPRRVPDRHREFIEERGGGAHGTATKAPTIGWTGYADADADNPFDSLGDRRADRARSTVAPFRTGRAGEWRVGRYRHIDYRANLVPSLASPTRPMNALVIEIRSTSFIKNHRRRPHHAGD